MSKMIEVERALLARFRDEARRNLGPTATEAEVESQALAAYEGEPAIVAESMAVGAKVLLGR